MIFIFASKSSETLHFDEHNIIEFLKRFKKLCNKYKIIVKKQWIKLFRYYKRQIIEFMKTSTSYINRNWTVFDKKMQKKYKNKNAKQMTNFRLFLKKYKSKTHINDQMRIYNRQFKNISIKLIQWKQLNIYSQCSWYLQNLLDFYRIKFVKNTILILRTRRSWHLRRFIKLSSLYIISMMFCASWTL